MTTVVDGRRRGRDKSADIRARFLRRYRGLLRARVTEIARGRSIRDAAQEAEVELPDRDISEPHFTYQSGTGEEQRVLPGNERFSRGDKIPKPRGEGGGAGGGQPGQGGDTEDTFRFVLTRDEFLGILFDDLELPRLLRTEQADIVETRLRRAGYTRQGVPGLLAVPRTLRTSLARRIAMGGALRRSLDEALEARALLGDRDDDEAVAERARLDAEIESLGRRLDAVPFLDDVDLRYRARVAVQQPRTAAVMICLMDVSASMDEDLKDIAKRFFLLLYLFLERKYQTVELVFVRHTEDADECSEQEFFHGSKSGGTRVLSGLKKVAEVAQRYSPANWNVYLAQASDGDAFGEDGARSAEFLERHLRDRLRFAVYLGVGPDEHSALARAYARVADGHWLAMAHAANRDQVYPAFRTLFLPHRETVS